MRAIHTAVTTIITAVTTTIMAGITTTLAIVEEEWATAEAVRPAIAEVVAVRAVGVVEAID